MLLESACLFVSDEGWSFSFITYCCHLHRVIDSTVFAVTFRCAQMCLPVAIEACVLACGDEFADRPIISMQVWYND